MCNMVYYNTRRTTLLTYNMKKDKHFSFRTTEEDWNYIVQLAETDDRTPSYVLNKMIKAFRKRGCFAVSQIN